MSLRSVLGRYLLAPFGVGPTTASPCPLCLGTDREPILYETIELTEHAVKAHTFEDICAWTRDFADAFDLTDLVEMVDAAFAVTTDYTTLYESFIPPDGVVREWVWQCQRCSKTGGPFTTETQARLHRTASHRCSAPLTGWVARHG